MRKLPTGTVTFLFSDIEGSTRLLGSLGKEYARLLEEHQELLRRAFAEGVEVSTEGDSFFCVFESAQAAVHAAIEAQRALAQHGWPEAHHVRVRIGLHTGEGTLGADNYVGLDLNRAARITSAAHGGQVIVSDATRAVVQDGLDGVTFRDLGEHRLKDLAEPEHLHQVLSEGLDREFPPVRSLDARSGNLPSQLTSFVGRRREVEAVTRALEDTRLLTLTGPGGTGKTRLSLQVARESNEGFGDGAFFVALAPISDPKLIPTTIGSALGLREDPGKPPIETVIEHLRDREALLVLDNFEQVIPAGSFVAEILANTELVKVLVTSREPLGIHGEHEFPVPPLELPDVENLPPLETLSQFEAVQLFVQRASAVKPGFEVTNENAPAVAEICARLDGLPLAIELAAARVKLLPPEGIVKRLGDRLSLLSGGARDLPARQQTLRGAIAWSHDLLDSAERTLFDRLSVFSGGFTLDAAEAVCAPELEIGVFDGVASLVNKSLLRQSDRGGGEPRFFLLQTIAEFAAESLAASGDAGEAKARHAAYFLELAETSAPDLFGERQAELLDALEDEHDNLRAALAWAVQNDIGPALRLAGALWRFWQMRGHLVEAAVRFDDLLALPATDEHPPEKALALEGAGGVHYWMADWGPAERYYDECLELRRSMGEDRDVARALYNLSFLFSVPPKPRRDVDRVRGLLEEALEIYRRIEDRSGIAEVAWALSSAHQTVKEWEMSIERAHEALSVFREVDDRFGAGWALQSIGLGLVALGRWEEARPCLVESMGLFTQAGDLTGIGLVLADFAAMAAGAGDDPRATRLRAAALVAERTSGQALVTNLESYYPWYEEMEERLDPVQRTRFQAEGEAMTTDQAVAYALSEDAGPPGDR